MKLKFRDSRGEKGLSPKEIKKSIPYFLLMGLILFLFFCSYYSSVIEKNHPRETQPSSPIQGGGGKPSVVSLLFSLFKFSCNITYFMVY
jgi:hypothetical protein